MHAGTGASVAHLPPLVGMVLTMVNIIHINQLEGNLDEATYAGGGLDAELPIGSKSRRLGSSCHAV